MWKQKNNRVNKMTTLRSIKVDFISYLLPITMQTTHSDHK